VVEQVRALPVTPRMIVVDTLHRFLAGDENSAQDTKTMLDACAALMGQFNCSVLLVHHTGVSEEAQHRARGSSAWRGALDIEISVVPGGKGAPMQIIQRKSKDSELAQSVFVELQQVDIPGWIDEDGQPVGSAVVVQAEEPKDVKKGSDNRKIFENAWWDSGCEERNGRPYLSRSALIDYLIQKMGISESSANLYVKPGAKGRMIFDLLTNEIIRPVEYGWIVVNEIQASALLIKKNSGHI